MKKQNLAGWEDELEQRAKRRMKKKKPAMKVSGAGVKNLQKIIIVKKKDKDV